MLNHSVDSILAYMALISCLNSAKVSRLSIDPFAVRTNRFPGLTIMVRSFERPKVLGASLIRSLDRLPNLSQKGVSAFGWCIDLARKL